MGFFYYVINFLLIIYLNNGDIRWYLFIYKLRKIILRNIIKEINILIILLRNI